MKIKLQSQKRLSEFASRTLHAIKPALFLWCLWMAIQGIISAIALWAPFEWKVSFTYRDMGIDFGVSTLLGMRANFDGYHYVTIARNGYGAFQQAFFPLFPILLKAGSLLFSGNTLVAGLFINLFFSFLVFLVWYKIFSLINVQHKMDTLWGMVYFLAFPTSFFLLTVYTESLFLLLFGLYVLLVYRRSYAVSVIFGLLLGLTRSAAVFAPLVPLAIWIASKYKNGEGRIPAIQVASILAPLLGILIYVVYLTLTTGDPLAFVHAQAGFNNNRSTSMVLLPQVYWRYVKILTLADLNVAYFVAAVEVFLFTLALVLLTIPFLRQVHTLFRSRSRIDLPGGLFLGLVVFSLGNLIYPTLTGTMSSIPRYTLVGMGLFLTLTKLRLSPWAKALGICVFLVLQVALFSLFCHGFFVS